MPKGYIYFAMAFSVCVEMLNLRARKKATTSVHLHEAYVAEPPAAAGENARNDSRGR